MTERERDLPSAGSLLKCLQQLQLVMAATRASSSGFPMCIQGSRHLAIFCCFPRRICRELDQKWSSSKT